MAKGRGSDPAGRAVTLPPNDRTSLGPLQAIRLATPGSGKRRNVEIREPFARDATEVRRARELVRRVVTNSGITEAATQDAELIVSELVTNAIRHGGEPIELQIRLDKEGLLIAVLDGGSALPVLRDPGPDDTSGRGLRLIQELSDRWSSGRDTDNTVVWAYLAHR